MSMRPARCTQADIARALRAAAAAGRDWRVEIAPDGVIRLVQGPAPAAAPADAPPVAREPEWVP